MSVNYEGSNWYDFLSSVYSVTESMCGTELIISMLYYVQK